MKKFVFTLFAVAALIACQSNNKQNQMTGEGEAVEIVGTDSTGLVDVFAYEGTVPTASGEKRQYGLLGNHYPKDRQCQWRIPNDNNLYNSRWEKREKNKQ